MEPVVLIHGYSSEGATPADREIEREEILSIFGELPGRLSRLGFEDDR